MNINITTMTTLEILKAAHHDLLRRWDSEIKHKERLIKEGKETIIADTKIDRYDKQIRELVKEICRLEEAKGTTVIDMR